MYVSNQGIAQTNPCSNWVLKLEKLQEQDTNYTMHKQSRCGLLVVSCKQAMGQSGPHTATLTSSGTVMLYQEISALQQI